MGLAHIVVLSAASLTLLALACLTTVVVRAGWAAVQRRGWAAVCRPGRRAGRGPSCDDTIRAALRYYRSPGGRAETRELRRLDEAMSDRAWRAAAFGEEAWADPAMRGETWPAAPFGDEAWTGPAMSGEPWTDPATRGGEWTYPAMGGEAWDDAAMRDEATVPLPVGAVPPTVEQIAGDLRRLGRQRLASPAAQSVLDAYDECLTLACRYVGIAEHLRGLEDLDRELERLRVEAALQAAGFDF
jgi:hypothetical protein